MSVTAEADQLAIIHLAGDNDLVFCLTGNNEDRVGELVGTLNSMWQKYVPTKWCPLRIIIQTRTQPFTHPLSPLTKLLAKPFTQPLTQPFTQPLTQPFSQPLTQPFSQWFLVIELYPTTRKFPPSAPQPTLPRSDYCMHTEYDY